MTSKKRSSFTLILTILVLSVGLWLPSEIRPTRAQVCGLERGCYTDFFNSCMKTPFTSLPAVNIHVSGDWYVSNVNGHCGARTFLVLFSKACGPPLAERICTSGERSAEAVPQLECVVGEQTGVIISRLVAGQAWACLAGACAIVVASSRINAFSMTVITIRNIASVPAVVAAVARQFSSMFPADSI